jgi:hypothetical protein
MDDFDGWKTLFGAFGYRVPVEEGWRTAGSFHDDGDHRSSNGFMLWIPWGMAQHFRKIREGK